MNLFQLFEAITLVTVIILLLIVAYKSDQYIKKLEELKKVEELRRLDFFNDRKKTTQTNHPAKAKK